MTQPLSIALPVRHARGWILSLLGLSLVLLLLAIGAPAVTRTQEARVLETARQMLPQNWPRWIVPRLNDAPRLQKPPLCYWMTAAAFSLFGVSEGIGRIPDALCGWLTLALVYRIGREWFDPSTGLLAATLLLSTYGFFRFTRLAETDGPSSMMVTLAVYALLRADCGSPSWLHVAAVAIAAAALAKGGPAVYPLLFLILYSAIENRRPLARRFFTTGAVVTALAVALPWFIYILHTLGRGVFASEVDKLASGTNHGAWPWIYLPMAAVACAPWTGLVGIALCNSVARWRSDRGLRVMLLWLASIAMPLCLIGNKQSHYLMPTLPPLMLITARTLLIYCGKADAWRRTLDLTLVLTATLGYGAIVAMAFYTIEQQGRLSAIDIDSMLAVLVASSAILLARIRFGFSRAIVVAVVSCGLLMPLCVGEWLGRIASYTPRTVATAIHDRFADGPFLFFGPNVSLPLCFHLRQQIRQAETLRELLNQSHSGTIVIAITKPAGTPPPLPSRFAPLLTLSGGEQKVSCYRDIGPP